jgi:hypothetical protein
MRRVTGIGLAVLFLVMAACGGGGDGNGGADEASSDGTLPTPTTLAEGSETADDATRSAEDAASTPTTDAVSAVSGEQAPAGDEAPQTTVATSPAAATVGARPGRYVYLVSGTASGGTPPTTQRHEDRSTLTVDPAAGRDQRSVDTGGEGDSRQETETLLRHQEDGSVLIVSLVLRGQLDKEFRPAEPVLAMKAAPATGDRWSWEMRSTDDTTTMRDRVEVLGREQVSVGGRTVDCLEVRHEITITTSFNGAPVTVNIVRTGWESPEARLSVKTHTVIDVPGFVHDESTATLESLDPS